MSLTSIPPADLHCVPGLRLKCSHRSPRHTHPWQRCPDAIGPVQHHHPEGVRARLGLRCKWLVESCVDFFTDTILLVLWLEPPYLPP